MLNFAKYHGLGNDFIFINNLAQNELLLTSRQCIDFCDRNFAIGADGVVFVQKSKSLDYKMTIINSDGTEAEMCGNATRCLAKYLGKLENITQKNYSIETKAGKISPQLLLDGTVIVDMNTPKLQNVPCTLSFGDTLFGYKVFPVSMGNPHCVIFVDNFDFNWQQVGATIETDAHFPAKTNVHFAKILDTKTVEVRVWERGAGETLACGTGACAVAVTGILANKLQNQVLIKLAGGNLKISWDGSLESSVFMTGPATKVFEGKI